MIFFVKILVFFCVNKWKPWEEMYLTVFTVIVEAKLSMQIEYIPVFVFWKPSDSSLICAMGKVTW